MNSPLHLVSQTSRNLTSENSHQRVIAQLELHAASAAAAAAAAGASVCGGGEEDGGGDGEGDAPAHVVVVEQCDLVEAQKAVAPSVTQETLDEYARIRAKFS